MGIAEADDLGVVLPGRYLDDASPGRLRNQEAIIDHAQRFAARLDRVPDEAAVLVLGGDCSLLVGAGLHLRRRGRYGLAHIDGHTDYRNPGNSEHCASLAGEDLAAATGKHWSSVANLDGFARYFEPGDVVQLGCRDDDAHLAEVRADLAEVVTAADWMAAPEAAAQRARAVIERPELAAHWVHLDVDVLDPRHLSAVDSPDPGGVDPDHLVQVLRHLMPGARGLQVTVFDTDLDSDGSQAGLLAEILHAALG